MTRKYIQQLCMIGVSLLAPSGQSTAGIIRADVPDEQYLALALDPRYQSVGRFWEHGFGVDWFASAVLVAPNWILTARHVPSFQGSTNLYFELNGVQHPFRQIINHPTDDLAVVELAIPVDGAVPAEIYQEQDEIGRVGTIVGFGDSTDSSSPEPALGSNRGPRRAGTNHIEGVAADFPHINQPFSSGRRGQLFVDFDYPGEPEKNLIGEALPLELEYSVASGDSGGGLFIDVEGETFLAGVVSDGNPSDVPNAGLWSGFIRLSDYSEWLSNYIPFSSENSADFNGDGTVDMLDLSDPTLGWEVRYGIDLNGSSFLNWQRQFGQAVVSGGLVAVPEPSMYLLLVLASTLHLTSRRTTRVTRVQVQLKTGTVPVSSSTSYDTLLPISIDS